MLGKKKLKNADKLESKTYLLRLKGYQPWNERFS